MELFRDLAAASLKYSKAEFCHLLEAMPVSAALFCNGQLTFINHVGATILESEPLKLVGRELTDFVHSMDQARSASRMANLQDQKNANVPVRMHILTALGNVRDMLVSSRMVQLESCNAVLICGMDLTMHSQAEAQLRESEQNFRRLFESMTDVYYRTDTRGVVQVVGPGVRRVLGYEPHEIIGRTAEAYYPSPADRDALKSAIMERGEVTDFSGQMVRKDGRIIDISISSHIYHDENNKFAGVEGIYRDVTDRKMLERELRLLASTDSLTGVSNRRAFFEQAEKLFNGCQRYQETMAILMLDLDHFKLINDRHGHAVGDNVLIRFAETVAGELRDTDCIGRLGGEEFCVLLRQANYENANYVSMRILDQVRALLLDGDSGETFGVTVSIGLAMHQSADKALKHLLDRADKALYEAKHTGRNRVICAT